VAIKEYKTSTTTSNLPEEELKALMHLQNSNIVSYYGSENDPRGAYRIFLEYVPGGSLTDMLEKWGALNTCLPYLAFYAKQLLEAVNCLHRHDRVHRDIKGDNLLINQFSGCVKLTDFNTCKLQTELLAARVSVAGTKPFMAPEVRDQRGEAEFSKKADIWSVGCAVWQMAMGRAPPAAGIDATSCKEVIEDKTLQEFIARCLHETPSRRPDASALLKDSFFEKYRLSEHSTKAPSFGDASSASSAAPTRPSSAMRSRSVSRSQSAASGFNPLDQMDADNEAHVDLSSILLKLFSAESSALVLDSWEKVVPSLHSFGSQLTGWKKVLPKLLGLVQAQLAVTNQPETEADAAPKLQKSLRRARDDFVRSWLLLGLEASHTDAAGAQQADPDSIHGGAARLLAMAQETIQRISEDANVMRAIAQAARKHDAAPHWVFILERELAEVYKQVTSSLADWQRRYRHGRDISDLTSEIDASSVTSSRPLATDATWVDCSTPFLENLCMGWLVLTLLLPCILCVDKMGPLVEQHPWQTKQRRTRSITVMQHWALLDRGYERVLRA
jgi:serine/threonine protein kinase